jgi:hypothetical protein
VDAVRAIAVRKRCGGGAKAVQRRCGRGVEAAGKRCGSGAEAVRKRRGSGAEAVRKRCRSGAEAVPLVKIPGRDIASLRDNSPGLVLHDDLLYQQCWTRRKPHRCRRLHQ